MHRPAPFSHFFPLTSLKTCLGLKTQDCGPKLQKDNEKLGYTQQCASKPEREKRCQVIGDSFIVIQSPYMFWHAGFFRGEPTWEFLCQLLLLGFLECMRASTCYWEVWDLITCLYRGRWFEGTLLVKVLQQAFGVSFCHICFTIIHYNLSSYYLFC